MRLALVLAGLLAVVGCGGSTPVATTQAPKPAEFVAQEQPAAQQARSRRGGS